MFTIKYRFYNLAVQQPTEGPQFLRPVRKLSRSVEVVSQERDDGYIVVHGVDPDGQPMTFGPHNPPDQVAGKSAPRPVIWVMNEQARRWLSTICKTRGDTQWITTQPRDQPEKPVSRRRFSAQLLTVLMT